MNNAAAPRVSLREEALDLMLRALAILDGDGLTVAACTLSLAIEQAGGSAPPPTSLGDVPITDHELGLNS